MNIVNFGRMIIMIMSIGIFFCEELFCAYCTSKRPINVLRHVTIEGEHAYILLPCLLFENANSAKLLCMSRLIIRIIICR
jgi:hypothetical protein